MRTTLVLGGTGKTGRRVVERLSARGLAVRVGSRSGEPPFEWHDPVTWPDVLKDVESAYLVYYPDLAFAAAAAAIGNFAELAVASGVRRLVLLSGRGEEEVLPSEFAVQTSGADWTVLRSSWINQNFSEAFLLGPVLSGVITLPAGDVAEPFVDAEDIADVAVAALTEERHAGRIYELTGPRALTFADTAAEIANASGRYVRYVPVSPREYASSLSDDPVLADHAQALTELFAKVTDGRNASPTEGVQRALGRAPRDFRDYARATAATGVWSGWTP
jgi:uncharacterized protein YbjT (DUF2867 family)